MTGQMSADVFNEITGDVISAAIAVHKTLGPGIFESVYHKCMKIELEELGVSFESEVQIPVEYRGRTVDDDGYRADLVVEKSVIVELKSVERVMPVHSKQLLTYLKLLRKPVGLLINFNVPVLKEGINRVVCGLSE